MNRNTDAPRKTSKITRRESLKRTALAGAGLWIGSQSLRAKPASPNEKLNIACIGVGGRGFGNIKGLTGENLVAFCDVDDVRAAKTYDAYPKVRRFRDFRRMFDKMEKEIDAVVVSTPDHTHFHPSMWALERGKHLFCEKPMAHNVWEVRQMTELAREKKVATQLGVQRHALENVHRVVELVQSGAIGEISKVYSWYNSNRGMPGDAKIGEKVPGHLDWDLWLGPCAERAYSSSYCPYDWRFWWDFGTGDAGNWGCHILDIPFWALGLDHPTRVEATGADVHPDKTPKSMSSRFKFAGNGQRGPVFLYWSARPPKSLVEKGLDLKGVNVAFTGSEGILVSGFNSLRLYPEDKFADFKAPEPTIPDSPGFHQEWISAAKGGSTPPTCQFDYSGPLSEAVLLANVAYRAGGGFVWDAKNLKATNSHQAQSFIREEYRKGWEL